jgi:hypothetical protein
LIKFIANPDSEHTGWNPNTKCGMITNPCTSFEKLGNYLKNE